MAVVRHDGTREYEGAVLTTRERNYHDDSDFYAVVWNGKALREVEYDTTRFGGGGTAEVDATEETKAAAREWLYLWALKWVRRDDFLEVRRFAKGKRVRFAGDFKGRKQGFVANGTEGTIIWTGPSYRYRGYRNNVDSVAGVKLDGGDRVVFVDMLKLEIIGTRQLRKKPEQVREMAKRLSNAEMWHAPFSYGHGLVVV